LSTIVEATGRAGSANPTSPYLIAPARLPVLLAVLVLAAVLAVVLSVSLGVIDIPAQDVVAIVNGHLGIGPASDDRLLDHVVWDLRLPRALLALVVGGGLAVAGVTIQAVVRSPLGDPYLIGIMSGASVGATASIVLFGTAGARYLADRTAPLFSIGFAAFLGALLAFALVLMLGRQGGRYPAARLIMAGVAIGYLFMAVTYYLQTLATPDQLRQVLFWSLGSVAGADWSKLLLPTVVVTACTAWLVLQGRGLNALVAGEETARSLGVDVPRFQVQMIVLAALLTAAAVTVAGGIIFIGLMVPHIVRFLVGADHRRVLPVAVLVGAGFLVVVDILARTVTKPVEIPLGVITAAIGAPFFMWLLRKRGRTAT
jgi:iron complex transport system permease protein